MSVCARSKVIEECLLFLGGFFDWRARIWVLIKVLEIGVTGQLRNPWWLDLLLGDHVPVDTLEPDVLLDVFSSIDHAPKSLGEVLL